METTLQEYKTDWLKVGKHHSAGNEERLNGIIDRMQWDYDYKGKEIAMMPALAIKKIIEEMRMPKVTAVCYNCHELAPYGFYGIEANYSNAKIRLFVVDEGVEIIPVCVRVWDNPSRTLKG